MDNEFFESDNTKEIKKTPKNINFSCNVLDVAENTTNHPQYGDFGTNLKN